MKILAYLRVSTSEQADSGAGLEAQRSAILTEATRRGWSEVDIQWIEDAGYSAKTLKRPGLACALETLQRGEATTLVVAKTDRLSRSLLDFTSVLQLASKQGWSLLALDSPVDSSTPSGEMMAHLLAVFAQFERRLIGERTRVALQARREAGVTLGRPRRVAADVEARILATREAGASYASIARELEADGVPNPSGKERWHPGSVRWIVQSRAVAATA